MSDTPARFHATTEHPAATTAHGGYLTTAMLSCPRPACQATSGGYRFVKVTYTLLGNEPSSIEFKCHAPGLRLRPWELAEEDREHLFGGTAW